jgi:hypothetical protein
MERYCARCDGRETRDYLSWRISTETGIVIDAIVRSILDEK